MSSRLSEECYLFRPAATYQLRDLYPGPVDGDGFRRLWSYYLKKGERRMPFGVDKDHLGCFSVDLS